MAAPLFLALRPSYLATYCGCVSRHTAMLLPMLSAILYLSFTIFQFCRRCFIRWRCCTLDSAEDALSQKMQLCLLVDSAAKGDMFSLGIKINQDLGFNISLQGKEFIMLNASSYRDGFQSNKLPGIEESENAPILASGSSVSRIVNSAVRCGVNFIIVSHRKLIMAIQRLLQRKVSGNMRMFSLRSLVLVADMVKKLCFC